MHLVFITVELEYIFVKLIAFVLFHTQVTKRCYQNISANVKSRLPLE